MKFQNLNQQYKNKHYYFEISILFRIAQWHDATNDGNKINRGHTDGK